MKIREGFVLRRIPGMNLVMPAGENIRTFDRAVMLNDTCAFIFEKLQAGETEEAIAKAMTEKYDVELSRAAEDVKDIFALFAEAGLAEESRA